MLENAYIRLAHIPDSSLYRGAARQERIIVSLTSFPERISRACYAVKSLMLQTCPPDEIHLWLAESQFPDHTLPEKLLQLERRGLQVRWCQDLRSHKKYYYELQQQQPDELVITYDDDLIYEADSIQKLMETHAHFPDAIICNRGHEMVLDENGKPAPYKSWKIHSAVGVGAPSDYVMPSTGNGCLYPYGCMPAKTFDWDSIQKLALSADDIWMRFCSLSNGIKVVKTRETIATLCVVSGSQKKQLTKLNDIDGENQRVLDRLIAAFPDVFDKK